MTPPGVRSLDGVTTDDDRIAALEAELEELRIASSTRQAEVRALAAELPAATSRRRLIKEMTVSVTSAPDRSTVIRRTVSKIARTPVELLRRGDAGRD
jgi:hypothetical protein